MRARPPVPGPGKSPSGAFFLAAGRNALNGIIPDTIRGGPRYFTEFTVTELTATDARKRHETFAKDLPTYRETAPPARLVKRVAHNDLGHELDAYFGFRSDGEDS